MPSKIVFKIGGNMKKDLRRVFDNPKTIKENTHVVYLDSPKDIPKILTPEKLRMLIALAENDTICSDVKTLTRKLHRKQESVSRDLNILEKSGLITKTKKGKNVHSALIAKEIVIQLA